jgi:outer membrane receptor for ferrienterochelin and colicin
LGDAGVEVTSTSPLGKARRWAMDIEWAADFSHRVSGSVSGYYRDFSNLYLEEQRFQFNAEDQAFSGPIRLVPGQKGGVAGGEAIAEVRPSSRFRFRTAYRYEQAASGDRSFRDVWDAVPRHLFTQFASCSPVSSLALWVRLNWVSDSHWHDYEDADAQTGGAYRSTLDGFVTLDASLTKWFWQRRLKASVLVRNLTGTVPRYHPIGASFDTTVFVGLEFLVGSMRPASPSRHPG